MPLPFKKVVLIVLDGFGLAAREPGNAILQAGMEYLNSVIADYPALSLAASGLVVGLPWGQPGNSEVGHSALGTGRIVIQDLAHINGEIRTGDFYKNAALLDAVGHAKTNGSALHIIGCTSPGGIHSHVDHLIALLELARRSQVPHVFVHVITDGQDMPPQDGINVLKLLKPHLDKANARIASIQGRSYAMDRVLNWELTERVWHAIALGDAPPISDPEAYLTEAYQRGESDYSLLPATVVDNGTPIGALHDNDAVIFFDFRNDRIRQLAKPLIYMGQFTDFNLVRTCSNVRVVTMTKYADEFTVPVAYPAPELAHVLGEIISQRGWRQWRIAEKEKEAHVTNFFNGGRITPFVGEERDIVSSRMMKGREYVEHPEMSLGSITETIRQKISDDAALYVVNIANPDMIGHTGDLGATIQAMRITDAALNTIVTSIIAQPDTAIIITADHGNAEELLDPLTSGADTQHSTRTVPAIFVAPELKNADHSGKNLESLAQEAPIGTLVDIAPTILYLLGIDKPEEMTGTRLLTVGDSKT